MQFGTGSPWRFAVVPAGYPALTSRTIRLPAFLCKEEWQP